MKFSKRILSLSIGCMLSLNILASVPEFAVTANADEAGTVEQSLLLGDANGDGVLTADDAATLQRYLSGESVEGFAWQNVDFDENQKINIFDSILMKQTIVEEISQNYRCEGGFITREYTTIETEHITFKIDENIYVRNDLALHADRIYEAIETVTGLSFNGSVYSDRLVVNVSRPNTQFEESEVSHYWAWYDIELSPGNLFINKNTALIGAMADAILNRNLEHDPGDTLEYGFSVCTTGLALKYLEENYPDTYALSYSYIENNYDVQIKSDIYTQSLEYWMENDYTSGFNGLFSVGNMLLSYLYETQGNFTSWIAARDELGYFEPTHIENEDGTLTHIDGFTAEMQVQLLESVYGEGILDGCYDWLRENESSFIFNYSLSTLQRDFTGIQEYELYPEFNAVENTVELLSRNIPVTYNNLEINISSMRFYLEKYKGYDTSDIYLNINEECQLEFYDEDGTLIKECSGGQRIPLDGVQMIKLVGEGVVTEFLITDFIKIEKPGFITQEYTVIDTEHITFKIDENIYVRNDLAEYADRLYEAIEAAIGLSFTDAPNGERLVINVGKYDPEYDDELESVGCMTDNEIYIYPGYLFISGCDMLSSAMIRILYVRNINYVSHDYLSWGFEACAGDIVGKYLKENCPDIYAMYEYPYEYECLDWQRNNEDIYTQPIEYWMENGYTMDYVDTGIAYLLVKYLYETTGDCTSWMAARDELGYLESTYVENEDGTTTRVDGFTLDMQIQLIKDVYGENILDGFYDWLRANESRFLLNYEDESTVKRDFTGVYEFDLYPEFGLNGNEISLIKYGFPVVVDSNYGLEIDLAPLRYYLEEYKGYDTSDMRLTIELDDPSYNVGLYNVSGTYMGGTNDLENLSLQDIYKIEVYSGCTILKFEITNYVKAE